MAMATINDVMALVDCVISHPSTTILDAVYEGKPVAVMNSFQRIFECLPNVDNLDNFTKFVEDCHRTRQTQLCGKFMAMCQITSTKLQVS